LAAGYLTGKLVNNQHAGTRFSDDSPLSTVMKKMFGVQETFEAVKRFDAEVKAQGLQSIEVALRWIAHHSALKDGDGIIVGASKVEQAISTVDLIRKGPLPETILPAIDAIWRDVKGSRGSVL
jgi:aflatoxin B1 aldehyde reductase